MASPSVPRTDQRPVPCPSNPILLAAQSQWLFTDNELKRTPSQLDGMPMEAEHTSRSKGVNFITQVGIMLKLPQLTLATAAVYMHRFFMRYSMVDLPQRPGMHPYPIAATSLFLATKVEENVRRMKELVVACCRVAQKQPNLVVDEQSKEFWKWRDTILHHEDVLLEALCFDLQLEQPYRILYDFICFFDVNENKPLRNAAWAFVNDSMFTVLCLQFTARTIAAAALYAAAQHCDVSFEDDESGRPWWEQIDVDLTDVRRACTRMAQLYENNAMQRHSQHYPTTPIPLEDNNTEKTRKPRAGSPSSYLRKPEVPGRKRSREPEDASQGRPESSNSQEQETATLNGERSPKRQRTTAHNAGDSKSTVPETGSQPPASSMASSQETATNNTSSPPSFQNRNTNGYPPPNDNPPPSHRRPSHPSAPARRPSQQQLPAHRNSLGSVDDADPIQQRIDEIVQQNMVQGGNPSRGERHNSDRYRTDWDRDRDRRPSMASGGPIRKPSFDHQPPPLEEKPPRPDQKTTEEPDDEGGGSEEGEL